MTELTLRRPFFSASNATPPDVTARCSRNCSGRRESPSATSSQRTAIAGCARDGETVQQLRRRVNRVILEDLETRVLAVPALRSMLRDRDGGRVVRVGGLVRTCRTPLLRPVGPPQISWESPVKAAAPEGM